MIKKSIPYIITITFCVLFFVSNNVLFIFCSIAINTFLFAKEKNFKKYISLLFVTYVFALFDFTILSPLYKRNLISGIMYFKFLKHYLTNECNFIPFHTIAYYIKYSFVFIENETQSVVLLNLLGNFICFIPFAIFIPYFFKKYKDYKKFALLILLIALGVECLQFITMTGSCDIDDIILNTSGCLLFYLLFHKEINRFYENNYKIVTNKTELKSFIIKFTIFLILVSSIGTFFIIRGMKEKAYWDDYDHFTVEPLNYNEVCSDEEKESFIYEDDLFKYYINCNHPEKIEVTINGNNYSFTDYLEHKTKYYVNENRLKDSGLPIKMVEKYEKLPICPISATGVGYGVIDMEILDVTLAQSIEIDGQMCQSFYIIPKSKGETEVIFETGAGTIHYYFTVDENNNYTYSTEK